MGAVEVRRRITVTEIERVIAVIEQAQGALLVQGMGVGIGRAHLQSVAHALLHMHLQGVVGRDTGCLIADGFSRVADIRNAQIQVAAFKIQQRCGAVPQGDEAAIGVGGRVAVGIVLTVNRSRGRRDVGLVERNRDHLVPAQVANVAKVEGQIVARLPLDVEGVVDRVRQLVLAIVNAKRDRLGSVR